MDFSLLRLAKIIALVLPIVILFNIVTRSTITVAELINVVILVIIVDVVMMFREKRKK